MTPRRASDGAVLTAGEAAMIRQALSACSDVLTWAGRHGSLQLETIVAHAAEAAGLGGGPGALACQVNLAIDYLDFAPAARSTR
jgi:hypothetical protein